MFDFGCYFYEHFFLYFILETVQISNVGLIKYILRLQMDEYFRTFVFKLFRTDFLNNNAIIKSETVALVSIMSIIG